MISTMLLKTISIALLIILYIIVFLILNTVHFQFLPVRVVMYDALLDAVIAGILVGIAIWSWSRARKTYLTGTETSLCIIVGFLLASLYAIVVPTIIDRSLSIYILEKLVQRGGAISRDAFPIVFKEEYLTEHQLVDIRLTEQLNSGTIAIKDGCVYLTSRGRVIASFTRWYRKKLLPKKREIMGDFTESLTDPFRSSTKSVDYRCSPPA